MKIGIYDETALKAEETIQLKLVQHNWSIRLVAVDEDGNRIPGGEIVEIATPHIGAKDRRLKMWLCNNVGDFVIQENGRAKAHTAS